MDGLLSHYLRVEDILIDLQVSDKLQVFKAIGRHFEHTRALPAEAVVSALLRREQLGSTAVGDGVAIPHARMQELDHIRAVYLRLSPALPFDTPDDKPVSDVLVLMVPSPAEQVHLDILAQAASLFLRNEFRKALHRCATPAEIKEVFDYWSDWS
ncbi:MAG: PTS sugar transporter subunit IIA [Nevskiaceae bacterium]|jgi:PTS system nitrogen regulatory IIA component|nr:PTS sugar transporter subunit IIA [Nevskiaceae bacterium]